MVDAKMMKWLQKHFKVILTVCVSCFAVGIVTMCILWGVFSSANTVSLTGSFKNIEAPFGNERGFDVDSNGNIYALAGNMFYSYLEKYDGHGKFIGSLEPSDFALYGHRQVVIRDDFIYLLAVRSDKAGVFDTKGNFIKYISEESFYNMFGRDSGGRINKNGALYEWNGEDIYRTQNGETVIAYKSKPWQKAYDAASRIVIAMFVSFLVLPWVWQYEEVRDTIKAKYGKKK